MTTVNRTLFPVQAGFSQITRMQERFAKLQVQLATGQKATNLAEMGSDRYFDLSIRARLGRIEGYQNSIATVNLRLGALDTVISRLEAMESEARSALAPGAYGSSDLNLGTGPALARSRFDELLNLLNTDVDGRHLFGGGKTDKKPVEGATAVLNGAAGKAGFAQIVSERRAADLGASGRGRVTVSTATDTTTLAEDGVHPFGFKLSTLTTTSSAIALTAPSGAPQSLAVRFNALPIAGETVTIGLTLPDGSEEGITLTAVTGTAGPGEFQIGADPDATAANFSAALTASLTSTAATRLTAASAFAAADNFFNAQGATVMRVDGPPFDTATALIAADPATTVIWYKGEDSATARDTVTAKVDERTVVGYGVQANETGLLELVRSLAATAVQSFPTADATSHARFDAVASRSIARLAESHNSEQGSIEMIAVELGNARSAIAGVGERHASYGAQLETMLAEIETVPKEEIAMEMLALQTRLTASYEATSMIRQMTLVNFLR